MPATMLYREDLKEYDFGPGHPFRGDRYETFPAFLKERLPEDDIYHFEKAEPASEEDLLLICRKEYIDFTRQYFEAANEGRILPQGFHRYHSGDNMPAGRPGRIETAARLVVGQAKAACRLAQEGAGNKAISIGGGLHHAKPSYGEGFCLYNDVAFSALYLMKEYRLERILILDTDAHAGNGTSEYFYDDPRVLFIDLHQDPRTLYPGTGFVHQIGEGKGKGFTVNAPLPPGAGYESYRLVFEAIVRPLNEEFRPQMIIRNGGSDPHFADQLTSLGLPVKGFRLIGDQVREMSRVCGDRSIDLIASGYNRKVLPYAWLALLSGLLGAGINVEEPEPLPPELSTDRGYDQTGLVVREVKKNLGAYWRSLR